MDGAPSLGALPAQDERFVLSERWMARGTGILYSSGAIVAFLWTFLPDRDEAGGSVVAAMASIALVLGLSMALGAADKAPRPLFHVVVATIQVVISVGFVATQAPISSIALFYIWATTYAWLLFGRGAAVAQTAWRGFCLAVALVVMQPALFAGVRVWMMVMATAVAMGLLVGIVADHATQPAAAQLRRHPRPADRPAQPRVLRRSGAPRGPQAPWPRRRLRPARRP